MHLCHGGQGGGRKRKRGDRVFAFKSFCEPGQPVEFDGPFHCNVWTLLQFGHLDTNLSSKLQTWSFQLELHCQPPSRTSLFVVEEPIEKSAHRSCHQCRVVGWGHHMICNRRFHFVVPSKERKQKVAKESSGNSEKGGEGSLLELDGHLMHGVFHSNGFGHLLSINGVEKGSEPVTGTEIMDLWDRICAALRARKVSLVDMANKRSMELRLIHGIGYGEPWFGRWGYKFGRGTYGVTQPMHQKAVEALRALPLFLLIRYLGSSTEIPNIVSRYQTISSHTLLTMGHLLCFMLELKGRLPIQSSNLPSSAGLATDGSCRWSPKRIEMAKCVIVEALKKAGSKWVSRQDVRDAARVYIGDTGLLDFVLKSLGNHIVGHYMVRRMVNPVTKVLEYCLEDVSNSDPNQEASTATTDKKTVGLHVSKVKLMKDLLYLHQFILNTGISTGIPTAARIVLDGKHLVKDYKGELPRQNEVSSEGNITLLCAIWLRDKQVATMNRGLLPQQLVLLPAHTTIGELKREVGKCFGEIYQPLRSFLAESIIGLKCKDSSLVYGLIESGSSVVVTGKIDQQVTGNERIYEGGNDDWVVDCPCGAKDDDGERMISCDICEVWQHIRCVDASEDVSQIFLCKKCDINIDVLPSLL